MYPEHLQTSRRFVTGKKEEKENQKSLELRAFLTAVMRKKHRLLPLSVPQGQKVLLQLRAPADLLCVCCVCVLEEGVPVLHPSSSPRYVMLCALACSVQSVLLVTNVTSIKSLQTQTSTSEHVQT